MKIAEYAIDYLLSGETDALSIVESFINGSLCESSGPSAKDLSMSASSLIKSNKGEWKSEKQGNFLLKAAQALAKFSKNVPEYKKAVSIAKQLGFENEKNSFVVLEMVPLEQFGKIDKSKIRYYGFMLVLDSGGVAYYAKVKVDHPKSGGTESAKLNLNKMTVTFKRPADALPDILVDFFKQKKIDKSLYDKINTLQKQLEMDDLTKYSSDVDILDSLSTQVLVGKQLSSKQLALFNKIQKKYTSNAPEVDIGLGDQSDWEKAFTDVQKFITHIGDLIWKNSSSIKQNRDYQIFSSELTSILSSIKQGENIKFTSVALIISRLIDTLYRSEFRGSRYISLLFDMVPEVKAQISKGAKKSPSKKAVKVLSDLRKLADLMKSTPDSRVLREISKQIP